MKATLLKTALEWANIEAEGGHNVMVLVPDRDWMGCTHSTINPYDPNGTIYIRCTTCPTGLKMVAIDTLILVAPDDPNWDAAGEALARERLRTSLDPRVIKVEADSAVPDVCFDCGKQNNPYSSEVYRWVLVHSHAERCCMKCFPKHKERWIG